jgi:hypothetical protein
MQRCRYEGAEVQQRTLCRCLCSSCRTDARKAQKCRCRGEGAAAAGAEVVQRWRRAGAAVQQVKLKRCRAKEHRCSGAKVLSRCLHSAEVTVQVIWNMQLQVQMCRGAEMVRNRRCADRGAEVQVQMC